MLCTRLDECESRRAGGLTSLGLGFAFLFWRRAHAYCAPRRWSLGVHVFASLLAAWRSPSPRHQLINARCWVCLNSDQHVLDVLVGVDLVHAACSNDRMQACKVLRVLTTTCKQ